MKIETFSIVAGSEAWNARCPFCISKMTVENGVPLKEPEVNRRNFAKACALAKTSGVTTVMFTGKGEPTLFPYQITRFLEILKSFEFPIIELQTNGIKLYDNLSVPYLNKTDEKFRENISTWYELGMTTIAISIVHYESEPNRQIYIPYRKEYIDLPILIRGLHTLGFSVRLTCIAANGFIDSAFELNSLLNFAKENEVEQLTLTPVNKPEKEYSHNDEAWQWTEEHHLKEEQLEDITDYVEKSGVHLMTLPHGAKVFDVNGQNLCLNSCLTKDAASDNLRNLIFFPDGHLRYYWQYPGAILL